MKMLCNNKKFCIFAIIILFLIANLVIESVSLGLYVKGEFAESNDKNSQGNKQLLGFDNHRQKFTGANADLQPTRDPDYWDLGEIVQWSDLGFHENKIRLIIGLNNLRKGASNQVLEDLLTQRVEVIDEIHMEGIGEAIVANVPLDLIPSLVDSIKSNGAVRYVEPDMKAYATFVPNDPYWSDQWGPQKIHADKAWDSTIGNSSVLVAVIDTGIDYTHPELSERYVPLGYDWVNDDNDPFDDNGHGTHVAGIIAATINNSIGIAGLAQVNIMAEKCLTRDGWGYYSWVAQAIKDAADKGADIISMSLSGYYDNELLHDAVKYAYDRGVLIIAAAGNDDSSMKVYPAGYEEVIAVAATGKNDEKAPFSNYGKWIELSAPGVDIISTWPHNSYVSASGTSMACPHVTGVAALIMSRFQNQSRDWVRLWLRYSADDLGASGFDYIYGYGRINAEKAVKKFPSHDLVISKLDTPPYVEPNSTAIINATILNFGKYNEENVTVKFFVNGTLVASKSIEILLAQESTVEGFIWTPKHEGVHNVTVYVNPVENETHYENNMLYELIYVGYPVKAYVLDSAGTDLITAQWEVINHDWPSFGDKAVYIDYAKLNKEDITYEDINATGADVLIISCAYDWEFTDEEIEAIKRYTLEGHGLVVTAGTLYEGAPNNNKLASLLGLNEQTVWKVALTDLLNLLHPEHPVFKNVPNPYTFPLVQTAIPSDGAWSTNELVDGRFLAMGYFYESAIVEWNGLVYISPWLEIISPRYKFNLQLLYNAITWSHYQKPDHDLVVDLKVPEIVWLGDPLHVEASVGNFGLNDEENVSLIIMINNEVKENVTIPILHVNEEYRLNYTIANPPAGSYNVTVYVSPVPGEERTRNNFASKIVQVKEPLIRPQEGQWAYYEIKSLNILTGKEETVDYLNVTYVQYLSPHEINVTMIWNENSTWLTVNIFTRWAEPQGEDGFWYDKWIETNVNIGSTINLLNCQATINDSEIAEAHMYPIECWVVPVYCNTDEKTYFFDKTTGLLIKEEEMLYPSILKTVLVNTNIFDLKRYEHELDVSLEALTFLPLGSSQIINATVFNAGKNPEENINFTILFNSTVINSTTIDVLNPGQAYTISFLWKPKTEGITNLTCYAQPLPHEEIVENNVETKLLIVKTVKGKILIDQTHGTDKAAYFSVLIENLVKLGFEIEVNWKNPISPNVLDGYDVFVIPQARNHYSTDELFTIVNFVREGKNLLVLGDDSPSVYSSLTSFAHISWVRTGVIGGLTKDITSHEVTEGVKELFINFTTVRLYISKEALSIARIDGNTVLAVYTKQGKVACFINSESFSDNGGINRADNLKLALNLFNWFVKKDTIPPQIYIISPKNEEYINNTSVFIRWYGSDEETGIANYSIYLNSKLIATLTETTYTLHNLTEGANNITITAYDKAGNMGSNSVLVYVDVKAPAVHIEIVEGTLVNTETVNVRWRGHDNESWIESYSIYLNGELIGTVNNTVSAFTVEGLTEGVNTITVVAYDAAGNKGSDKVVVTVDLTPPEAVFISPANNSYLHGTVDIKFTFSDTHLKNASLLVDGIQHAFSSEDNIYVAQLNTENYQDGMHFLMLVVEDKAGNVKRTTLAIIIDNTPPEADIISPTDGAFLNTIDNVSIYFFDENFENASLYINGQKVKTWNQSGLQTYSWDIPLENRVYELVLDVIDKAGNSFERRITVVVDNISPSVSFIHPENNSEVSGVVNVEFNVTDVNLASVTLIIDDVEFNVTGLNHYDWDTTKFQDGKHTITIVAVDKAGNISKKTLEVKTINELLAKLKTQRTLAVVIGVIAVFTVVTILLTRRKRQK